MNKRLSDSPRPHAPLAYPDIAMSRALARFSDDLVKIPGTDIGIGADAVVGLIPGIGDLIGTGLSSAIMVDAVRQRVPIPTLARMGFNLLLVSIPYFINAIYFFVFYKTYEKDVHLQAERTALIEQGKF